MDINLYNFHFLVGGIICQCSGSKNTTCENNVQIMGEKGYIHVSPGSSNCQNSRLILRDSECSFCLKETRSHLHIVET